jgi:outer membrane protein with beta-barrel domain
MRRLIVPVIGLAVVLALSIPSFAQEVNYPKAEIFGGFSISSMGVASVDPTTGLPTTLRNSFWGWQGSANGNLTHSLAIVGDFGGQYKTVAGVPMNSYQFLFGPRITFRRPRVTPFVHALFGGAKLGTGSFSFTDPITGLSATIPGASSTGLGLAMGGGIDVNMNDRLALRVPQFDWTPMHVGGVWTNNVIRIGIGLVVKAGQK